jgi:hypothetical protein
MRQFRILRIYHGLVPARIDTRVIIPKGREKARIVRRPDASAGARLTLTPATSGWILPGDRPYYCQVLEFAFMAPDSRPFVCDHQVQIH